jgi:hypothetical protein
LLEQNPSPILLAHTAVHVRSSRASHTANTSRPITRRSVLVMSADTKMETGRRSARSVETHTRARRPTKHVASIGVGGNNDSCPTDVLSSLHPSPSVKLPAAAASSTMADSILAAAPTPRAGRPTATSRKRAASSKKDAPAADTQASKKSKLVDGDAATTATAAYGSKPLLTVYIEHCKS